MKGQRSLRQVLATSITVKYPVYHFSCQPSVSFVKKFVSSFEIGSSTSLAILNIYLCFQNCFSEHPSKLLFPTCYHSHSFYWLSPFHPKLRFSTSSGVLRSQYLSSHVFVTRQLSATSNVLCLGSNYTPTDCSSEAVRHSSGTTVDGWIVSVPVLSDHWTYPRYFLNLYNIVNIA